MFVVCYLSENTTVLAITKTDIVVSAFAVARQATREYIFHGRVFLMYALKHTKTKNVNFMLPDNRI